MGKKVISILLAAIMIMNLSSGLVAPVSAEEEKQLSVELGPDPETLDPALNTSTDGGNIIIHMFECLLTVGEDGAVTAGQAESWELSEDGLVWTFHLRDGLKWSDGSDLTADDFVYSWKRVCDPETAAPYADTALSLVDGFDDAVEGDIDALNVVAEDDQTLVVTLSSPCTFFDSLVALATLSPVKQATVEENGDSWAISPETYICNGPFMITEWVPGSYIMTGKNPYYWNADEVKLDSIKWYLIEDSNAAYSAYLNDEVQFIKDVPTEEIPNLRDNEEFHVDTILGTYYIAMNNEVEPFTDPLVRKAMSLAIDREYVAETLMQGTYTAASNFVGPGWIDTDGTEFMDNSNEGEPYLSTGADIEGALEALEEAGYPNGEGLPVLTYSTNDQEYHKVVAEYLQQAWAEIGITVEVEVVEWASFLPMRRAGDYEISREGWVGDYTDPSNILNLFYSTNGNNTSFYNNPDYDAVIDTARTTIDAQERSEALHEAEDIMMEDYACIPLAYYNDFWLQSSEITGSWHTAYGYWYFKYADIEN